MAIELKVPSPGESINEVQIARWIKADGDFVEKDEEIAEIDSDKATLGLVAEADGVLKILVGEGETVAVGSVVATIDTNAQGVPKKAPAPAAETSAPTPAPAAEVAGYAGGHPSVAAKKLMDENNLTADAVKATGKDGRITKGDVLEAMKSGPAEAKPAAKTVSSSPALAVPVSGGSREARREKMTMLRKKVAQRLVSVKQTTAMLTTFNEVDMSAVMNVRKQYKDVFKEKHGVSLGFMSFFTKAVCEALKAFPAVNAQIDGDEIVYHDYCDVGIAVSAPKGLMVPVLRNAEAMSLAQIEAQIGALAGKARDGKISIEEMTGGTFTITNGGVFGSMMSTPIINPPQSAILGMHNIVERPVAVNGKVEIRPIMYLALSYDHRIIDGRESVGFLVKVKQMIEDPIKLMTAGNDPMKVLLQV
ncbi:MAG TPA: 2-oxoglutarate dehydrogenase complex dihydrolipoyllysine-residue succinyltransferase [Chitinophagales bacterium]|nr:2-oxoglutarate dehydrogenase complex dihydrolipoyllysine-residue succinyltransferase [Chitinophagales bacterium]